MKYKIIKTVRLKEKKSTGFTKHIVDESLINDNIKELKIINYPEDSGYYLFYCDDKGFQITDTYHDSITAALEQAELEFKVKPDEWEDNSVK